MEMMKHLSIAGLLLSVLLAGCSTASGPTFNAYSIDAPDGTKTYMVECHGLFESNESCQKVALKICEEKPLHILRRTDVLREAAGDISDPRELRFQCGEPDKTVTAPVATVEPSAAPSKHYDLMADALFNFNESDLSHMLPTGRAELDKLIAFVNSHYVSLKNITVIGYADRLGSPAGNVQLSLERAATVRDYLASHGIDRDVIQIAGAGSSKAVVDCPPGEGAAVIACLQPNRRVTIDIRGVQKSATGKAEMSS